MIDRIKRESFHIYFSSMPKIKPVKKFSSAIRVESAPYENHEEQPAGATQTVRTLLSPNTSIGQHFLKNPAVVDAIVHKSQIQNTDIVLEVGEDIITVVIIFIVLTFSTSKVLELVILP